MIITTSRKPSRRTRSLAKFLAKFLNFQYVNRGKNSIEEISAQYSDFWIISEIKGNPAFLTYYHSANPILKISFASSNVKKDEIDESPPIFIGKPPFDPLLFNAIPQNFAGLKLIRKLEFKKKIFVKKDRLYFYYNDEPVLGMRIFSVQNLIEKYR
ncbi:MAG: rRNA maturation protein [Archaeoglobaceae archaeon]